MVLLLVACFLISLVLTSGVILYARDHGKQYDLSMPQRFHAGSTPRLGGVAIALTTMLGWFAVSLSEQLGWTLNVAFNRSDAIYWSSMALPALIAGCYEDSTQGLGVRSRLLFTLISAFVGVWLLDLTVPRLGIASFDSFWQLYSWPGVCLAIIALAGLPHAFNLIDGFNGLAAMVSALICGAIAHVALQLGDRQLAAVLVCLIGASGGFLFWNYPRSLIFAGDGGAYFWGILIAGASIVLVQKHAEVSPWFPMLLVIYPVWETVFSVYRKLAKGQSPGVADALHFHQLIFRRIVRSVFHDDQSRRLLMRNNRTSPYLWSFALLTVIPAVLFWNNTPILIGFCLLFIVTYVAAYLMIIRFKVPRWLRR
jgi:UDP-GlcNAc:undecaprenyl-phosphate/decaprenyl-phosphate GlcNAc-1-phosphate transferase